MEVEARDAAIVEARLSGASLYEIGARFSLTRERIRQILKKRGGPTSAEARAARRAQQDVKQQALSARIRTVLEQLGASTPEEVAEALDEVGDRVAAAWPIELAHLRLSVRKPAEQEWSDAAIFAALQAAASYSFPLTAQAYRHLVSIGEIDGPSLPRIGQRFGSWVSACAQAGVEPGRAMRDNYQSKWTDDELLQAVRSYFIDPTAPTSFKGYDEWKRSNNPDGPSAMTLRNRLGAWSEIKRMALPGNTG